LRNVPRSYEHLLASDLFGFGCGLLSLARAKAANEKKSAHGRDGGNHQDDQLTR